MFTACASLTQDHEAAQSSEMLSLALSLALSPALSRLEEALLARNLASILGRVERLLWRWLEEEMLSLRSRLSRLLRRERSPSPEEVDSITGAAKARGAEVPVSCARGTATVPAAFLPPKRELRRPLRAGLSAGWAEGAASEGRRDLPMKPITAGREDRRLARGSLLALALALVTAAASSSSSRSRSRSIISTCCL